MELFATTIRHCRCGNRLEAGNDDLCDLCSWAESQPPHHGHWTVFGLWFCDTCESAYCELA